MDFQDLSEEQLDKIIERLRGDEDICVQNTVKNRIEYSLSERQLKERQDEEIDDWLNTHNRSDVVLEELKNAYD